MKNVKTFAATVAASGALAPGVAADFVGWTVTSRSVPGGYLINVFAVTNSSSDVLLNVFGGSAGSPSQGTIGGCPTSAFIHGPGSQATFAPAGSQSWTTLDSFLTIGGGLNTTTDAWTANGQTVISFGSEWTTQIPPNPGWYLAGMSSPARNLSSLGAIRIGSSSAAASASSFGMLVAQLHVTTPFLRWQNMGASMRRVDNSLSQGVYSLNVPLSWPDSDQDGVHDGCDECPTTTGTCSNGCPPASCGSCGPCPCPSDLTGDRAVGGDDLGLLLGAWGPCGSGTSCAADLTADGIVDGADLGVMLGEWGNCD